MRRKGWGLGSVLIATMACSQDRVDLGPVDTLGAAGGVANPMSSLVAPPLPVPTPPPAPLLIPTAPASPPTPLRFELLSTAATPPPAISGGTLAVTDDGRTAVAADPDRDQVYLVDVETEAVQTITLPRGSEPGRVALDAHGRAHVALRSGGALVRIDLSTAKTEATTELCQYPRGAAYDPAADTLVVACANGELVELDAQTHEERSRHTLDRDLRDVVITQAGARFISRYRSAELLKVEKDGTIAARTSPITQRLSVFGGPLPPDSVDGVVTSPTLAWRTNQASDGTSWMVHQRSMDDSVPLSKSGYSGAGPCGAITRPSLTHFDANGQPLHSLTIGTDIGLAVDQAASPSGEWIAVADPSAYMQSKGTLKLIQTQLLLANGDISPARPADPDPRAAAQTQVCDIPGTAEYLSDSQTTSVTFDRDARLFTFSRMPAQLHVFEFRPSGASVLVPKLTRSVMLSSDMSVRDSGHDLFHANAGSGMSCASCHGEALDDGHVWTFHMMGARRTQTIRGGILQTFPLHWAGDIADMRTLTQEVMMGRMSSFFVSDEMSDALGQWIDRLPPLPLDASDPAAAERGKVLFEGAAQRCSECHKGSTLTDNQSYDVGTGGMFQVPTLRGLALHAPFMHTGCAKTLADRFNPDCGGGDAHGNTSQLSQDQLHDLVAYLETL
ncbi:MAG: cytochrome-c peroxidase [Polyangiales bacterium]